ACSWPGSSGRTSTSTARCSPIWRSPTRRRSPRSQARSRRASPTSCRTRLEDLSGIVSRALAAFSAAGDAASLENAKARFLGKSGELTSLQSTLKSLSPEQKRTAGIAFNGAKQKIEAALEARRAALADQKLAERLSEQSLDVTLPARGAGRGGQRHVERLLGQALRELLVGERGTPRFERRFDLLLRAVKGNTGGAFLFR